MRYLGCFRGQHVLKTGHIPATTVIPAHCGYVQLLNTLSQHLGMGCTYDYFGCIIETDASSAVRQSPLSEHASINRNLKV